MKVTKKESIIWASGHYLTNHLPNYYDEWEEEELDKFLEDNVCFMVEEASPKYIWEYIDSLAYDFELTVNKKEESRA